MTTAARMLTVADFERLPEPEAGKLELDDGVVVLMSPVGKVHGRLARWLGSVLSEFVEAHGLGEVFVETGYRLLTPRQLVRAPDVSFVRAEVVAADAGEVLFQSPPDLAIEIASTSDRRRRVTTKVDEYLQGGCRRVWVIWPDRGIVEVHRAGAPVRVCEPGDVLGSDDAGFEVDSFSLPVSALFGDRASARGR